MFNISIFSVFSNVFLLTITTDQIPRLIYTWSRKLNFSDTHLMNNWPVHQYGDDDLKSEQYRINHTWLNYFESTMTQVNISCIAKYEDNILPDTERPYEFLYPQMFRRYFYEEVSGGEYIPAAKDVPEKLCDVSDSFFTNIFNDYHRVER